MGRHELMRYLDYCSEMLSLTNKLAALYAQNLPDSVVIDTVNDIEELTPISAARSGRRSASSNPTKLRFPAPK